MVRNVCGCPIFVDYDNKNDVYFDEKYKKLSITPNELHLRQNGGCWLEAVFDKIDGKKVFGCLYCTNGTEYAETNQLLNPTNECIRCLTDFLKGTIHEK